jgi:hypothetical protein
MSKPSSSSTFRNPQIFEALRNSQISEGNDSDRKNAEQVEVENSLQFELKNPISMNIPLHSHTNSDGQDVVAFLNTHNYTEEVHGDYVPRRTEYPMDREFLKPQVTKESLIQDGRDIVRYLEQSRYADDMNSKIDDYDVTSLIKDFEESTEDDDPDRLEQAVKRLQQLKSQLTSKL